MTYGEMVTRICQLRDEMRKTEAGREALEQLIGELQGTAPSSEEE